MKKKKKISVDFRLWIFSDGEKLIGKGRVELLERIRHTGSILQAANEMKMSYRQAWQMVKEMNERSSSPLVEKILGGSKGGGAVITAAGEKAIEKFHAFESNVRKFIRAEMKRIRF